MSPKLILYGLFPAFYMTSHSLAQPDPEPVASSDMYSCYRLVLARPLLSTEPQPSVQPPESFTLSICQKWTLTPAFFQPRAGAHSFLGGPG